MPHSLRASRASLLERPHLSNGPRRTQPRAGHAPPDRIRGSRSRGALLRFQNSSVRNHSRFQVVPERDQELARQGHDSHPPRPARPGAIPLLEPEAQSTLRLVTQPRPGNLDRHGSQARDALFADPLVAVERLAASPRQRHQACQGSDLTTVAELTPAEELLDEHPGTDLPDGAQQHQLLDHAHRRTLSLRHLLLPQAPQLAQLSLHQTQTLPFPLQPQLHLVRQRRPVPQNHTLHAFDKVGLGLQEDPLAGQQPLDSIAVQSPFLSQRLPVSVQLTTVLLLHARHPHHTPNPVFPIVIPQQLRQQLLNVQLVGLRPTGSPVHFYTRGVHHHVVDAERGQKTVQPKTITAGLVTAHHPYILGQLEALPRLSNLRLDLSQVSRWHRPNSRLLALADGEPQFPLPPAQ